MFNRHQSFSYIKKLAILLVLSSQVVGNQFLVSAADARVLTAQIIRTEPTKEEQADNLRKAGIAHLKAKQFTQAEDSLKRAWRIYRDLGDDFKRGLTLNDLGLVYRYQEDYRSSAAVYGKAIEAFEKANRQAITTSEKTNIMKSQWTALYNFGVLSYQRGLSYPEQSREQKRSFRRALSFYDGALAKIGEFRVLIQDDRLADCIYDLLKLSDMESLILESKEQISSNIGQFQGSTILELKSDNSKLEEKVFKKRAIDNLTTENDEDDDCSIVSDGQSVVLVDDGDLFD